MALRGLLTGVAVVFIISAVTFAVLFPGNVDDPDPSPLFESRGGWPSLRLQCSSSAGSSR